MPVFRHLASLDASVWVLIGGTCAYAISIELPCADLHILLDFSLSVKAATLIFISGRGSAISYAKEGKSGFIYNSVKS